MVWSSVLTWTLTFSLSHLTNSPEAASLARSRAVSSPFVAPRTVLMHNWPTMMQEMIRALSSFLMAWTPGPSWTILLRALPTSSSSFLSSARMPPVKENRGKGHDGEQENSHHSFLKEVENGSCANRTRYRVGNAIATDAPNSLVHGSLSSVLVGRKTILHLISFMRPKSATVSLTLIPYTQEVRQASEESK